MDFHPRRSAEWLQAMERLIRAGHAETALRELTAALADDPHDVGLVHMMSQAQLACGRSDAAIADARRAVGLSPDDFGLLVNLSNILRETGDPRAAVEPARAAVALEPGSHGALGALARAHLDSGSWQEGKRVIERSLQILPGCNGCRNNLAFAMYNLGELRAAAEVAEQVLASNPNDVYALCMLGDIRCSQGREGEAHRYFLDARRLSPNDDAACQGVRATAAAGAAERRARRTELRRQRVRPYWSFFLAVGPVVGLLGWLVAPTQYTQTFCYGLAAVLTLLALEMRYLWGESANERP